MIKPEDLRIGDLVMVSNDNCMIPKGALCEVVAIDSERACEDKKGLADLLQTVREEWEFSHGVWCNNIEGIPLTPELLEKNGFKEEQHQKEGTSEWYDSIITTSASISCTRSKKTSLPPTSTAKSYEKLNTLTNSNISFGRWA